MANYSQNTPEAGSKSAHALPSDKPGALPPENGFPLNNVRVPGQTDPCTQCKRDAAPLRARDDGLVMGAWLQPDPLEAEDRPGRKSRLLVLNSVTSTQRLSQCSPVYTGRRPAVRLVPTRAGQQVPARRPVAPTTLRGPWVRGCPLPPQKHGRSCGTSSTLQNQSSGGSDCDLQPTMAATVTCSYTVGWHRWTLGWGNFVYRPFEPSVTCCLTVTHQPLTHPRQRLCMSRARVERRASMMTG